MAGTWLPPRAAVNYPDTPQGRLDGQTDALADYASLKAKIADPLEDMTVGHIVRRGASAMEGVDPSVLSGTDAAAIHDNVAGEIAAVTEKVAPVAGDWILIEDGAAGNAKKKIDVGNIAGGGGASVLDDLTDVTITAPAEDDIVRRSGSQWVNEPGLPINVTGASDGVEYNLLRSAGAWGITTDAGGGGGPGSDTTAIHDNENSEISAIAEKVTPVSTDLLLIEDSAASNSKRKLQIGNLPSGGAHTVASHSDTTATGTELETLTNGSNADSLHVHAGLGAQKGPGFTSFTKAVHVSKQGNDSNDGLSWDTAKLTVAGALAALPGGQSESFYGARGIVRIGPGIFEEDGGGLGLLWGQGTQIEGFVGPGASDDKTQIKCAQKHLFDDVALIHPSDLLESNNEWMAGATLRNLTVVGADPYIFDGAIVNGGSLWTFHNSGGGSIADTAWRDSQLGGENYARTGTQGNGTSNYLGLTDTTAPTSSPVGVNVNAVAFSMFFRANAGNPSLSWEVRHSGELLASGTETGGGNTVHKQWSRRVTLSAPTGGWTWTKVSNLDIRVWKSDASGDQIRLYRGAIWVNPGTTSNVRIYNAGYNTIIENVLSTNADLHGFHSTNAHVNLWTRELGAIRNAGSGWHADINATGFGVFTINGWQSDDNGWAAATTPTININCSVSAAVAIRDLEIESNVPANRADDPAIRINCTGSGRLGVEFGGPFTLGGTSTDAVVIENGSGEVQLDWTGHGVTSGRAYDLVDHRGGTTRRIPLASVKLARSIFTNGIVVRRASDGHYFQLSVNGSGAPVFTQVST